jgi:hypothetical protein
MASVRGRAGCHGFVLTGSDMQATGQWPLDRDPCLLETSVPGVFACGDMRSGPVKRVAASVGEGSMAIAFVHQYLRDAHWTEAKAPREPTREAALQIVNGSAPADPASQ